MIKAGDDLFDGRVLDEEIANGFPAAFGLRRGGRESLFDLTLQKIEPCFQSIQAFFGGYSRIIPQEQ